MKLAIGFKYIKSFLLQRSSLQYEQAWVGLKEFHPNDFPHVIF
jgi:hypothetical protein